MGEIKSVKVDNWGVFFLQKLQNFFNKTDYCDLTLQFRDNSQLKVHRLVLSACTDYFNVLEQTCEVIDDALIMPIELQADVVVPIVNFMYTGTLEFELKMYGKLLRTAKEMNMTVLLKLLEAHRRTMEGVNRAQRPPSPKPIRRRGPPPVATASQQQQQRRVLASANVSPLQRRLVPTKIMPTGAPQPQFRQQIGSTSLLRTSAGGSGTAPIKIQFGGTSTQYETQHQQEFKHEPEDFEESSTITQHQQPPSPFEQLRKGYNNNKRPASATFISPPAKKPNIEDVKEFAEQQRMRKQIAAEYGDDQEYEGMLDDDIHNDDDDDDAAVTASSSAAAGLASTSSRQQVQQSSATITFKQEQNDKPPTIVVKDSSNSKMNHAKIISEVLRQYPHLVKSNKNIKLKIMPNVGGQPQKIIVKKEQLDTISSEMSGGKVQQQPPKVTIKGPQHVSSQTLLKPIEKSLAKLPSAQKQSIVAAVADSKSTVVSSTGAAATSSAAPVQKRRIDSKTMHALIAQGAENTTGPWLCLRCGVNGRPISIPSYRGFRRHLINTHKEAIDSALCEHCGWRSSSNRTLHYHMQMDHKVKTTMYTFPECLMCKEQFLDTDALNQHMVNSHPDENKQQCIYCNKIFAKESQLYTHTKLYHKKQALEDGIIDYSDEEFIDSLDMPVRSVAGEKKESKIKILSDISLPSASSLIKLEPSSEAASLSTMASGIAASIGIASAEDFMAHTSSAAEIAGATDEPKFVNADGNEMQLTEEQRKEIISQLNQDHDGGMVMVLNDQVIPGTESAGADAPNEESESETLGEMEDATAAVAEEEDEVDDAVDTTEEDFDDNQIYGEFTKQRETGTKKATPTALDESKESVDNLEWAENLISAHEMEDEAVDADTEAEQQKAKKDDDISKKLKELTGDWSDDENDDDDEVETTAAAEVEAEEEPVTEAEAVQEEEEEDLETKPTEQAADGVNIETEIREKSPETDLPTETATAEDEPASSVVEPTEEVKLIEDDIELAMKSLHKDELITENEPTDVEASTAEEASATPTAEEEEVPAVAPAEVKDVEPMTVDEEEHASDEATDKLEELHAAPEEKQIEENIAEERVEKGDDNDNEETPVESVPRKTLLEELIAESDIVKDEPEEGEEMEFLTIPTKALLEENEQEFIGSESREATAMAPTEAAELTSAEATPLASSEAAVLESTEAKDSTAGDEQMDTSEAEAVATTTTVTSTSAAVGSKDAVVETATASQSASKTEDKVKSLISEWVDDDDDAEEEL